MATTAQLKAAAEGVRLDDERTEAIIRQHVSLTDAQWANLDHVDLFVRGDEAKRLGLADEVAEFTPPLGSQVYSI